MCGKDSHSSGLSAPVHIMLQWLACVVCGSAQKKCAAAFCQNNDEKVFVHKFSQIRQGTIASGLEVVCKEAG